MFYTVISKATELLIAIVHYLNQFPQCDLQPADCQTRLCKCYFRRSRDFKVSKGCRPLNTKYLASYTPRKLNLLLKNGSRLKCLKISLLLGHTYTYKVYYIDTSIHTRYITLTHLHIQG